MSDKVIKEKNIIIITDPDKRITNNFLSRFEIAHIISTLAEQVSNGREYDEEILEEIEEITAINIAQRIFERGETGLKLHRAIGDNIVEEWLVEELIYYET